MSAFRKYLKWIGRIASPVAGPIVGIILLGIAATAFNMAFIWVSKKLIDIASGAGTVAEEAFGHLMMLSFLLVAFMLLRVISNTGRTHLENNTFSKNKFIMRGKLFSLLMSAQWQGKGRAHSGDTMNRLFSDVDTVTKTVCMELTSMAVSFVQLIAAFIFLGIMDLKLAVILLCITPAFLVFNKFLFRKMRHLTREIKDTESLVQSHIQESLQNKMVVMSLEYDKETEDQLEELQKGEYEQVLRRTRFNVFSTTLMRLAFGTGYVVALLDGAYDLWNGLITFGALTAFLQLVGQIQGPAFALIRQIPSFIYAMASVDRIEELEQVPTEEKGEPVRMTAPAGITLKSISFHYPDSDKTVLKDFSFDFTPGSRTAIFGETGAGKSTLIRIMMALLKPVSGSVELYSGEERTTVSPNTRNNFVYVPQGNTLFSGTIRDNLLMGNPEASEEQMWEALDTVAAEFVHSLPKGLDTECGERADGFSEGQAQRIAIARGLLRPGSIMLFDEFSSSIDSSTERRLMNNLTSGYADKTMIFITHREAIADYCQDILNIQKI